MRIHSLFKRNNQFDEPHEPRERICSLKPREQSAPLSRGELTKSLAQSITRRAALKKFGVSVALAGLLGLPMFSHASTLGPLIEIYRASQRYPDALKAIDEALRATPERPALYVEQARVYLAMQKPAQSIAAANHATVTAVLRLEARVFFAWLIRCCEAMFTL